MKREAKGPGSPFRNVFGGTCPFHAAILARSVLGNAALALTFPTFSGEWGCLKCVGETDVENEFWEAADQVIFLV